MKKCPRCKNSLEEVKIKSIYQTDLFVDRCPSGCGIWFDKDEIFKSKKSDIEKIDLFDNNFIEKEGETICPLCNIKMGKYRNPSFKIDFEIDYCLKCKGFWFDRNEALKFKNIQEEKYKKLKEETKITLKPSVQNFEKVATEGEEADKFMKFIYSILRFFLPI